MKISSTIGFLLLLLSAGTVSGQVSNRSKVIAIILSQPHIKAGMENNAPANNIYAITAITQTVPQGFRTLSSVPKYCLAKGAVICRLEEYVQLHAPFKLNIGVGGE